MGRSTVILSTLLPWFTTVSRGTTNRQTLNFSNRVGGTSKSEDYDTGHPTRTQHRDKLSTRLTPSLLPGTTIHCLVSSSKERQDTRRTGSGGVPLPGLPEDPDPCLPSSPTSLSLRHPDPKLSTATHPSLTLSHYRSHTKGRSKHRRRWGSPVRTPERRGPGTTTHLQRGPRSHYTSEGTMDVS